MIRQLTLNICCWLAEDMLGGYQVCYERKADVEVIEKYNIINKEMQVVSTLNELIKSTIDYNEGLGDHLIEFSNYYIDVPNKAPLRIESIGWRVINSTPSLLKNMCNPAERVIMAEMFNPITKECRSVKVKNYWFEELDNLL